MKNIYTLTLLLLSFLFFQNTASAEELYPLNHTFKITFNQSLNRLDVKEHIKVYNSAGNEVYTSTSVENNIVSVSPRLSYDQHYTLVVDDHLTNSRGKKLKKGKTFLFQTIKNPNYFYGENSAPVSTIFKSYADEHLLHKSMPLADYYYSNVISGDLVSQYNAFYETKILPYVKQLFPLVEEYSKHPTFVFLGNEFEQSTLDFAEQFYSKSALPYGWFTSGHNITIMTQTGYLPPYNSINTILLPHEYFHWLNSNVYKSSIPSWLNEGIAYNLSWAMYYNTDNFMNGSLYDKYKNSIAHDPNVSIQNSNVYMVVTAYIQGMYGQQKLESLVKRSAQEAFEVVFEDIYGKTVTEMVTETQHFIESN